MCIHVHEQHHCQTPLLCTQDCYIHYTCVALPFRLYRWGSGWRPPTGRWRGDVPSCPPTTAAVACALTQSRPRSDLQSQTCIADDVIHGNYINPKHGLRLCVVLWCHSYSRSSIFIDIYWKPQFWGYVNSWPMIFSIQCLVWKWFSRNI